MSLACAHPMNRRRRRVWRVQSFSVWLSTLEGKVCSLVAVAPYPCFLMVGLLLMYDAGPA